MFGHFADSDQQQQQQPLASYAMEWNPDHRFGNSDIDAEMAMQSTSKVPPYWAPGLERRGYPFKTWLTDVGIWAAGTELQADRMGAAVAQSLGGVAKEIARECNPEMLRDGTTTTGLEILLRALTSSYGEDDIETAVHSMIEFATFRRLNHESIDDAIGRFITLRHRAETLGGFTMSVPAMAWQALVAFQVPRTSWPTVFAPMGGKFPRTKPELEALMKSIKTQGHIAEHTHSGPRDMFEGQKRPGTTGNYYGDGGDSYNMDFGGGPWGSTTNPTTSHEGISSSMQGSFLSEDGYSCCAACGQYLYQEDEDYDPDTASEDEDLAEHMTAEELSQYFGECPGDLDQLREDYLFAKRRYRHFARKAPRHVRFPRRPNWSTHSHQRPQRSYAGLPGQGVIRPSSLAGGKGKGGGKKGFRRTFGGGKGKTSAFYGNKNPVGADGEVMKCHECGADDHLVRQCPKAGKGKGNFGKRGSRPQSLYSAQASALAGVMPHYLTTTVEDTGDSDQGEFAGIDTTAWLTIEETEPASEPAPLSAPTYSDRYSAFPWWKMENNAEAPQNFITRTRMRDFPGTALLIDPGSPSNLTGSDWSQEHVQTCRCGARSLSATFVSSRSWRRWQRHPEGHTRGHAHSWL